LFLEQGFLGRTLLYPSIYMLRPGGVNNNDNDDDNNI
jgi:hypothetical protein